MCLPHVLIPKGQIVLIWGFGILSKYLQLKRILEFLEFFMKVQNCHGFLMRHFTQKLDLYLERYGRI